MAVKVSPILKLTILMSTITTSVVSVTYIILCVIGLIYYFRCDENSPALDPYKFFWGTIYRTYLQNEECDWAGTFPNLTRSHTIYVLQACVLSFSLVNLITAAALVAVITKEKLSKYIDAYVYIYVGFWLANLVVDVTLGTHFGMDITYLHGELKNSPIYIPLVEVLRQGAFYLMAISLKGFVIYALQIVLICLILIHLNDCHEVSIKDEHSIHTAGPIHAFDQRHYNHIETFTNPDRYSLGPLPRSHGPSSFRRSDSWNHQGSSNLQTPSFNNARPFSYLEEPRRPPKASNSPQPLWTTPVPQVPPPDYTPKGPRKLKSAIKPYT